MGALLQMFNSNSCKSGGVQEDALMAVATLVEVLGENFMKYMELFKPFLFIGLKNHEEYQVCISAVGLIGDICRALKSKVSEYCDEIMVLLLENLGVRPDSYFLYFFNKERKLIFGYFSESSRSQKRETSDFLGFRRYRT